MAICLSVFLTYWFSSEDNSLFMFQDGRCSGTSEKNGSKLVEQESISVECQLPALSVVWVHSEQVTRKRSNNESNEVKFFMKSVLLM